MGKKPNEMSDFGRSVARAVRREMGDRQMSGRALAAEIGKSEPYVRARIAEKLEFTLSDIESIAPVFGLTLPKLLRRAEEL